MKTLVAVNIGRNETKRKPWGRMESSGILSACLSLCVKYVGAKDALKQLIAPLNAQAQTNQDNQGLYMPKKIKVVLEELKDA